MVAVFSTDFTIAKVFKAETTKLQTIILLSSFAETVANDTELGARAEC